MRGSAEETLEAVLQIIPEILPILQTDTDPEQTRVRLGITQDPLLDQALDSSEGCRWCKEVETMGELSGYFLVP